MKKHESMFLMKGLLGGIVVLACCAPFAQTAAQTAPQTLNQGSKWNNKTRAEFYSQDQGSRIIPLKWINALKQPNGEPFLAANLRGNTQQIVSLRVAGYARHLGGCTLSAQWFGADVDRAIDPRCPTRARIHDWPSL